VISRSLVRLLAITCGVTIANIYYAQPLLHTIAHDIGVSESAAGIIVTTTQLGYAAGLLFVVPLGDIIARRPLISTLLAIDAVALAATAAAPGLAVLAGLAVIVGCTSVVVQMTIPYAATLARDEDRARTIGTLMSALLLGILLSRTFSGLVASVAGWRGVYGTAAGLMVVTTLVLARVLPPTGREVHIGFGTQMRAIARLAAGEPVLRWRTIIGAAQFAAFSCFWTTVTFLLSAMHYSQAEIGLFALVGAAGACCALTIGRQLGRHPGWRWRATGIGIALFLVSFGILSAGSHGIGWLIVGALLMDACAQAIHVSNQAVIYDLVDSARSRITTIYMTVYFIGGALGTTVGTTAYDHFGWGGACSVSLVFGGIALCGWLGSRRHELVRVA
jgi:predicted MFS family arabinose efflux permease